MLTRRDWKANVFAHQTLGNDAEVELWYLAEHFLLAWHDWHTLQDRFLRYFGEPDEQLFPAAWQRLDVESSALADRLLGDKQLDELIFEYWLTTGAVHVDKRDAFPSLRDLYQSVVQNHRRWSVIRDAELGRLQPYPQIFESSLRQEELWPQCRKLVRRLNEETLATCKQATTDFGNDLRFHLRHYRHANLLVSWLVNGHENDDLPPGHSGSGSDSRAGSYATSRSDFGRSVEKPDWADHSALLHLMSERIVIPSFKPYLDQIQDDNLRGTAELVLERITQAISEIGFEEFVEDLSSSDFRGGPESLVGASSINLIPSEHLGPCRGLLLAVSKGDKKSIGFPSIMRNVREHLIRCPETKAVIVLCDWWWPTMLDEHLGDLRAHHAKNNVRFLFLMAGTPGRIVSPVAVDLSFTP
jgi:hypothetical protein